MEQHPVPRNISGFQFRLVGDMTLRQFTYLAGGALIAYILFRIAPFPAIINYPLVGLLAFTGVAFAFLPIQERPLDKWLAAFIKSITSPTQFVWKKANPPPDILIQPVIIHVQTNRSEDLITQQEEARKKLQAYLATLPIQPHENINLKEKKYIENTLSLFNSPQFATITAMPTIPLSNKTAPAPAAKTQPTYSTSPLTQQSPTYNQTAFQQPPSNNPPPPISQTPKTTITTQSSSTPPLMQSSPSQQPLTQPHFEKIDEVKKQLNQLANEKKRLEEELARLKQTVNKMRGFSSQTNQKTPSLPSETPLPPRQPFSDKGAPVTPQTPNMIIGSVKDPERKILPNIIITIKDKEGLPLRALKTNKIGQFSIATPLPNGSYFMEAEDPLKRYTFETINIILSGEIVQPVEFVAKGQKEIIREKLTKELFGNTI